MAYASHKISHLTHIHSETLPNARKILKKQIIDTAEKNFKKEFRCINKFVAITDDVFIMPCVDHHDDTTFTSLSRPHSKARIGWRRNEYQNKREKYSNMKKRQWGLADEYLEKEIC